MEYLSVRDFRNSPKEVWEKLKKNGKIVITNNGRPTALMVEVDGASLAETLAAFEQAEAMRAVNRMRMISVREGNDGMSEAEIEAEIRAARGEKQ